MRLVSRSGVTDAEVARRLPGDDMVAGDCIVMDRAATLPATPERVWPWLVQLGKGRAGWYFPQVVDRVLPPRGRGLRHLDPGLADVQVGDLVPDWGPGDPSFRAEVVDPGRALVWLSLRDRGRGWRWPVDGAAGDGVLALSWALVLRPADGATGEDASRLHLRLRIRRRGRAARLVAVLGGLVDELTVRLLFAGLRERVSS